eukprot:scaffold84251_cov22-Prasinocladus_malaysianus.AAC.2
MESKRDTYISLLSLYVSDGRNERRHSQSTGLPVLGVASPPGLVAYTCKAATAQTVRARRSTQQVAGRHVINDKDAKSRSLIMR